MKTKHIIYTLCYSLTLGLFITSCASASSEESDMYPRKGSAPITDKDVVQLDDKGLNADQTMSFGIYDETKKQAYVYDVAAKTSTIEVPSYVSKGGKRYLVIALGKNSFEDCTATIVNLPATIEKIEDYAFKNATKVVTINLNAPTPPTRGSDILNGATNAVILVPQATLETYKSNWNALANRLSYIGDNSWNNKVSKNAAGDGVSYVSSSSSSKYRYQDTELTYTTLSNYEIAVYSSINSAYKDLVIPGEIRYYFDEMPVNHIYDNAFKNSKYKTITLPSSIKGIGNTAFQACSNLESITIPEGVTAVSYGMCYECPVLKTVNLPSTLTTIDEFAFQSCPKLDITIPASVTSIGKNAFANCVAIRKVDVPEGVTVIHEQTFMNCTELNTVTIPSALTSIEQQAFAGCTSLFSIDLPATLTTLGKQAFYGCKGLETVICRAVTPPSIGSDTFNFANSSACVIYVPAASVDAYKQAPNWRNLANRIQAI